MHQNDINIPFKHIISHKSQTPSPIPPQSSPSLNGTISGNGPNGITSILLAVAYPLLNNGIYVVFPNAPPFVPTPRSQYKLRSQACRRG